MTSVLASYASPALGKKFVLLSATANSGDYVRAEDGSVDANAAAVKTALAGAGAVVTDLGRKVTVSGRSLRKVKFTATTGVYNVFYIDVTGPVSNWASLNV